MASFGLPMSVCISRRSPVRIPRRDLVLMRSDTPFLELTVYQTEGDAAPVDITGAQFLINLYRMPDRHAGWWDYGCDWACEVQALEQIVGTIIGAPVGRVDFPIALNYQYLRDRSLLFALVMSYPYPAQASAPYAAGNWTLIAGCMEFIGSPIVPQIVEIVVPIAGQNGNVWDQAVFGSGTFGQ